MSAKKTVAELEALMKHRFPGMEHYFVSCYYEPIKAAELRRLRSQGIKPRPDVHKAHHFFLYCGFVDSLLSPTNAQCWRSTNVEALCRLVLAEDPLYVHDPDCIPETRRRFKF